MIQGFKFYVKGEEMRELFLKREQWTRDFAKDWASVESTNEEAKRTIKTNYNMELKRADEFAFAAAHVNTGEIYELTRDDFSYLGIGVTNYQRQQQDEFMQFVMNPMQKPRPFLGNE